VVGGIGYGVSLVLFMLAVCQLGPARTGAYFSTAPFLGAAMALVRFREPMSVQLGGAAVLLAIGVYLHLSERHEYAHAHAHAHAHEVLDHDHRHVHDEHHRPDHCPGDLHTHAHHHPPMRHKHPHYPNLYHRHDYAH
jgi:hypothetical protein